MATISNVIPSSSEAEHIRAFDVRRDLGPIADLVETCFSDSLDPDGQRYLEHMRSAARNPSVFRWLSPEFSSVPLRGFVWEDAGRLVGNASLIPYPMGGRMRYLIANVAVHPEYRRRGIARSLTHRATEYVRQRGLPSVWLHVREHNDGAIQLYRNLGFIERARRTTWVSQAPPASLLIPSSINITQRQSSHWALQQTWLKNLYPKELSWHLPIQMNALQPGLLGFFYRNLHSIDLWQRSAIQNNRLTGVLTWQSAYGYADHLFLAVDPRVEEEAAFALLHYARRWLSAKRSLALDYPAGRASQAIQASGFAEHQTLIWMEKTLR